MAKKSHTYDLGIIGNCSYLALIDSEARVSWMCLPRFDSSFIFGSLLDHEQGGELGIYGLGEIKQKSQYYVSNTNVLVTEIRTAEGAFRVTDCAPRFKHYDRFNKPLILIRKIEAIDGNPRVKVLCSPRSEYATRTPQPYLASNHLRYNIGANTLRVYSNIPLNFILSERHFVLNEPKYLMLTWDLPLEAELEFTAEDYIQKTIRYWQSWVRHCSIGRFYQKEVLRSALVLKLHQFEDTGAIIAAATTSLPEAPGSGRNWDYRYCWLRDAYYTLNAFSRISQFEEMIKFANFIENIAAEAAEGEHYPPVIQIDGNLKIPERFVEHLKGYDNHGKVRIGNQAYSHIQNDIYGQMIYAILQLYIDERFHHSLKKTSKQLIMTLLNRIACTVHEPDATLWEFRNSSMMHCYTSLFHWVGSKSAAKIAHHLEDREMLRLATKLVTRSAQNLEECYNPQLEGYAQSPGSSSMDASSLQLINLHFLDPQSERAAKHLKAVERELKTPEGLLYRYLHTDDFGKPETTFLVCAFWYVEALASMGQIEQALHLLDRLLQCSNHLGLFSEDVDAANFSQWGNFPQVYSHVGLMNAVFRITSKIDFPEFF